MSLEKQTLIEENLQKVFSDESFKEMLSWKILMHTFPQNKLLNFIKEKPSSRMVEPQMVFIF